MNSSQIWFYRARLFCLLLLLTKSVNGQIPKHYIITQNSLPSFPSFITCIIQHKSGMLVAGTRTGLYVYDGYSSRLYPNCNNNYTYYDIAYDGSDTLLFSSSVGFGIHTGNGIKILIPEIKIDNIRKIGNKWLLIAQNDVYLYYAGKTIKYLDDTQKPAPSGITYKASNQHLYALKNNALYKFENGSFRLINTYHSPIKDIYELQDQSLLVLTDSLHITGKHSKALALPDNSLNRFFTDRQRSIYLTGSSIYQYKNSKFTLYLNKINDEIPLTVENMFFDYNNRLWIMDHFATYAESEFNIKEYDFSDVDAIELHRGGEPDSIRLFYTSKDPVKPYYRQGRVTTSLSNLYKPSTGYNYDRRELTGGYYVKSVNNFYRSISYSGYEYFNYPEYAKVKFEEQLVAEKFYLQPHANKLWLQTEMGLLNVNGKSYKKYAPPYTEAGIIDPILCMDIDTANDNIYIGTKSGRVALFNSLDGSYHFIKLEDNNTVKPSRFRVRYLFSDPTHLFIVRSGDGVYSIEKTAIKKESAKKVLELSNYHNFKTDDQLNLWCLDINNFVIDLFYYNKFSSDKYGSAKTKINLKKNLSFDLSYPIPIWFAFENSIGTVSIMTIKGIYTFKIPPQSIKKSANPLFISELHYSLDNKQFEDNSIFTKKNIRFPYNIRNLQLSFGTLSAIITDLKYRYRFKNKEPNWTYSSTRNLGFDNINSGEYTLEVQYSPNGIDWSDSLAIELYIDYPWWENKALQLSAYSLLIVIIYLLIKNRFNRIKRMNSKLEEKISLRTQELSETITELQNVNSQIELFWSVVVHDIKSPIRFISDVAETLSEDWEKLNDDFKSELATELAVSTRDLHQFTTQFLAWMKLKKGSSIDLTVIQLSTLFVKLNSWYSKFNTQKNNRLDYQCDERIKIRSSAVLLELILHNLIENADKHTSNGLIEINATLLNQNEISITCSDNGAGISETELALLNNTMQTGIPNFKDSFKLGLILVHDICKLLGGRLSLKSVGGKGTQVFIVLPAYNE